MEEVAVELDFEDCIGKMRIAPGKGKGRKKKKNRAGSLASEEKVN